jgi:hypothetical protein
MSRRDNGLMTRKPVMADVARLAGVSHQTVSRVINGSASIRPATRRRVEDAIAQLGYRPNTAARALVTNRSGIIGIIGTNTGLYGPSSVQRAVEEAAHEAGYFSSAVPLASVTHQAIRGAVEHLSRLAVEAIVMIAAQQDALTLVQSEDFGVPVIVVEGDLSGAGLTVGVDQVGAARKATQHLIDLGHTAIAHVSGPPNFRRPRGAPRATWTRCWPPAWCRTPTGTATGARRAGTRSAGRSPRSVRSQRFSWPTTRWPSACCMRCTRQACRFRTTSAWSVSTTSPRPPT